MGQALEGDIPLSRLPEGRTVGALLPNPSSIPKQLVNAAVAAHELASLAVELLLHGLRVALVPWRGDIAELVGLAVGACHVIVSWVAPVDERLVEPHTESSVADGFDKLLDQVAVERLHGSEGIGILAVEKGEAVVVLGGERHIAEAGLACQRCPVMGVEVSGVKILVARDGVGQLAVFLDRNAFVLHVPLALGWTSIEPPMDEKAQLGVAHPVDLLIGLHGQAEVGERLAMGTGKKALDAWLPVIAHTGQRELVHPAMLPRLVAGERQHKLRSRLASRHMDCALNWRPVGLGRRETDVVLSQASHLQRHDVRTALGLEPCLDAVGRRAFELDGNRQALPAVQADGTVWQGMQHLGVTCQRQKQHNK